MTIQRASTQLCKYSRLDEGAAGQDEVQLADLCKRELPAVFRPSVKSQSFAQAWPSPTTVPVLNFKHKY